MDHIDTLIARFRAEKKDRNGALQDLLPAASDPRVVDVLVSAISEPTEDPMARVSALEYFERSRQPKNEADRLRLLKAMLAIIAYGTDESLDDQLVREYAVRALTPYAGAPEVTEVVVSLLMDPKERRDVRRAAFYTLAKSAPWP